MGHFRIEGVTGPDEYSAIKDNNVYTNLMAQRNLACAADAVARLPAEAEALGVSTEEAASWRDAANAMYIPFDERLGVHPQHEGFTDYARWDFKNTPEEEYPLLLHFPYFQLYRKQVVKQADLVLAMYLRSEAFTAEQKAANFAYYEPLTVRDSSLSACTQAVMAAEVGQLDLAHDYLAEAALMDLRDVEHNTSDGVHMASLAGAWMALVAGFGGMRAGNGPLAFSPRLPDGISRLTFRMRYRGRKLSVKIQGQPGPVPADGRRPAADHPPRRGVRARAPGRGAQGTAGQGRSAPGAALRPPSLQPRLRHLIRPRPVRPWGRARTRLGRVVQPERQVLRGQHAVHHAEQVAAQHVQVDLLAQLDGKLRDHALGVVPGPVEPPVDHRLNPPAQRVEQRGRHQHRGRDGDAPVERRYVREQGDAPEVDPDHQPGHHGIGHAPRDDLVDRVEPVLQHGDADGQREGQPDTGHDRHVEQRPARSSLALDTGSSTTSRARLKTAA